MAYVLDYLRLYQNKVRNSHMFIRFLLSYVIVLLIPILILILLLFTYFFHVLEKEVIKNNNNILEHVQYEMDTRINEMNTIAFQIYNNWELSTYNVSNNPVDGYKGIALLENYIVGSKYIDNVGVYYAQINEIYSSTRTYPVQEYLGDFFPSGLTEQQFVDQIGQIRSSTVIIPDRNNPGQGDNSYIAYLVPKGSGSKYDQKMVMFLIRDTALNQMLASSKGDILVVDNHSQIVADPDYKPGQPRLLKSLQNDAALTGLQGSDFVSRLTSNDTGWTYIIKMPASQAMHEVIWAKTIFLYALLFLILAVGFMIFFVTRYNYKPIRQLKQYAETKTGNNLSMKNDIEAVRLSIENMSLKNNLLSEKVKSNHTAVKEFLLLNLLKGHYSSVQEFNENAKDTGIHLRNSHYCVSVLNLAAANGSGSGSVHRKEIICILENALPEGLEGYGVDSIDNNIIFIWASAGASFPLLDQVLNECHNMLNTRFGVQVTVGVGNSCTQTDRIGKSYIEAFAALDYRFIKGKNKILHFKEVLSPGAFISHYPVNELKSLELHMMEGNTEQIDQVVSGIIGQIIQDDLSLFEARCLCFDVINTVLKTMYVINKEFASIQESDLDVTSLTKFETIGELGQAIKAVCSDVCQYIKENKNNHTRTLTNQFIAYIKANYNDPNFTVQGMAEHFKMSMPNLCYYFKKETSQNVSDYVNYYKIEKAKELLMDTTKTLNEIIYELGYYDVSSFIKKFKKEVGITPGIFRKMTLRHPMLK